MQAKQLNCLPQILLSLSFLTYERRLMKLLTSQISARIRELNSCQGVHQFTLLPQEVVTPCRSWSRNNGSSNNRSGLIWAFTLRGTQMQREKNFKRKKRKKSFHVIEVVSQLAKWEICHFYPSTEQIVPIYYSLFTWVILYIFSYIYHKSDNFNFPPSGSLYIKPGASQGHHLLQYILSS